MERLGWNNEQATKLDTKESAWESIEVKNKLLAEKIIVNFDQAYGSTDFTWLSERDIKHKTFNLLIDEAKKLGLTSEVLQNGEKEYLVSLVNFLFLNWYYAEFHFQRMKVPPVVPIENIDVMMENFQWIYELTQAKWSVTIGLNDVVSWGSLWQTSIDWRVIVYPANIQKSLKMLSAYVPEDLYWYEKLDFDSVYNNTIQNELWHNLYAKRFPSLHSRDKVDIWWYNITYIQINEFISTAVNVMSSALPAQINILHNSWFSLSVDENTVSFNSKWIPLISKNMVHDNYNFTEQFYLDNLKEVLLKRWISLKDLLKDDINQKESFLDVKWRPIRWLKGADLQNLLTSVVKKILSALWADWIEEMQNRFKHMAESLYKRLQGLEK